MSLSLSHFALPLSHSSSHSLTLSFSPSVISLTHSLVLPLSHTMALSHALPRSHVFSFSHLRCLSLVVSLFRTRCLSHSSSHSPTLSFSNLPVSVTRLCHWLFVSHSPLLSLVLSHTLAASLTCCRSHSHSLTRCLSLPLSLSLSLVICSLSLILSFSPSVTRRWLSLTLPCSHVFSLSRFLTRCLSLFRTRCLSHSLSHTLSHSPPHTMALSHSTVPLILTPWLFLFLTRYPSHSFFL